VCEGGGEEEGEPRKKKRRNLEKDETVTYVERTWSCDYEIEVLTKW
jgi:hypothetical protein